MERYTITLGASTTAGGKVITASSHGSINGRKIAVEDDAIICPACRSQGKILCVGPRISETWNGKQVALENDMCLCGCFPSPRLIANQSFRSQMVGQTEPAGAATESAPPPAQSSSSKAEEYDLHFLVIDESSGLPASDWPYSIELAQGQHIVGRTDLTGKTTKVAASYADDAILRVQTPEPTPINPFWDR